MYNQEIKERFIRRYTTSAVTAKACQRTFDFFEPYEIEWGADLCTRSADELQPIVDSIAGLRAKSKWSRLVLLKDYTKWCIAQKVEGACSGMLNITTTGLDKIVEQTVSSPRQLQTFLNAICLPEKEEATDNIYRCFYWLAFMGMPEDQILNVKISDVDFETLTVRYADTEFPMYRESLPAFKNCAKLTQFKYVHPYYTMYKDRVCGDTLIRGITQLSKSKTMRVELSRRNKRAFDEHKTEKKLSRYRVWMSGLFYKMYEREMNGEPVDFTSAAIQFIKDKNHKLDIGQNSQECKVRQIAREYQEDYNRWKLAYLL